VCQTPSLPGLKLSKHLPKRGSAPYNNANQSCFKLYAQWHSELQGLYKSQTMVRQGGCAGDVDGVWLRPLPKLTDDPMALQASDMFFLRQALESFIETSVQRVAYSGDMHFRYTLSAGDIKESTGRQRMHGGTVSEYIEFFRHHNVQAQYNERFSAFEIELDLNRCVLDQAQARHLSAAMSLFRAEHG